MIECLAFLTQLLILQHIHKPLILRCILPLNPLLDLGPRPLRRTLPRPLQRHTPILLQIQLLRRLHKPHLPLHLRIPTPQILRRLSTRPPHRTPRPYLVARPMERLHRVPFRALDLLQRADVDFARPHYHWYGW
jgi:hypothetical protein